MQEALAEIEELDLSYNRLSGRIPRNSPLLESLLERSSELGLMSLFANDLIIPERTILIAIFWVQPEDPQSDMPLDQWEGVTLGSENLVTELNLEDQHRTGIPEEIAFLRGLQKLDMSGNQITGIPPELAELTSLVELDLSNNQISSIDPLSSYRFDTRSFRLDPRDFGFDWANFTNLRVLNLADNPLTEGCMPDSLPAQLDMSRSNLGDLPLCSEHEQAQAKTEQQHQDRLATERQALVALYNATGGPDWWDSTNWLSDEPVRKWSGIKTQNNYVVGIELYENNLIGRVPPELANLTSLETLHIFGNTLTGCIPSSLRDTLDDTQLGNLSYCP